jgi:exodeoxyribonuclease VII large subunit
MSGSLLDLFDDGPAPDKTRRDAPPAPDATVARADAGAEPPASRRVLTVSELAARVRAAVEHACADVWVEGEVSNCRPWKSGHIYLTLKDADAQVSGVIFRTAASRLRFKVEDGLHVVVRGRVSTYAPRSEYQIVCEHVEPAGLGALQLAFDQLKARLAAEGLFDEARKRALPTLPRKIGVVTSLDGAAIRDIIHVLRRRYPNAHVVVRPTRVQGEGAAQSVARAVAAIGRVEGVDVVIVGRGGGSIEDLWAFNEEPVARAIAACPVPIISAVGHETDVTIADFVADVRAPTPSAAAELVVARKDEFASRIDRLAHRAEAGARAALHRREAGLRASEARGGYAGFHARLATRARRVADLTHGLRYGTDAALGRRRRALRDVQVALDGVDLRRRLGQVRTRLLEARGALGAAMTGRRHRADRQFREAAARLGSLSPLAVLGRGYAVCWNEDRTTVVRRATEVAAGARVRVTLGEGELACEVTDATGGTR